VNASVLTRAKLGKSVNGKAPYGYQWKDRKLVIQPEEAAVRRKAYELFVQHRRKGFVARALNAAGLNLARHVDCPHSRRIKCQGHLFLQHDAPDRKLENGTLARE